MNNIYKEKYIIPIRLYLLQKSIEHDINFINSWEKESILIM